jgi:hypothetical protein
MNREGEAVRHLLHHLDGSQVLAEATLRQTLDTLATWASAVGGTRVDYNRVSALRTLTLVVATGDEVPYATAAVSTFGGEG